MDSRINIRVFNRDSTGGINTRALRRFLHISFTVFADGKIQRCVFYLEVSVGHTDRNVVAGILHASDHRDIYRAVTDFTASH